jgi:hypothetical protein
MKPGDVVHAAVRRGGEGVRSSAFDAADALLAYVDDEAGPGAVADAAVRGTIFRALTSAFCCGYLHGEAAPAPPRGEVS